MCSARKSRLDFRNYYFRVLLFSRLFSSRRIGLHILEQHILCIGKIRDFYKILMRSMDCQPRIVVQYTVYTFEWIRIMIFLVHENFHGFSGSHMHEQNAHWISLLISEHWIPDSHLLFSFTPGLHMLEQNAHCIGLLLLKRWRSN